ncbi:hypothetical protein [Nocardia gipuzkoensis]
MGRNPRTGHPLRTTPEEFSDKLPWATRVLNAKLNELLEDSGLSRRQVIDRYKLGLTDRQASRQMGEDPGGPSKELFDAILGAYAHKKQIPLTEVEAECLPLLDKAREAAAALKRQRVEPGEEPPTLLAPPQSARTPEWHQELREKTEWLLTLLCDAEERQAAQELDATFGTDHDMLTQALVTIGDREPGAVAALLEEVRVGPLGQASSTALLEKIRALDAEVADRIAAVPLRQGGHSRQESILELDPTRLFARRMTAMIRKGDLAQARREVAAKVRREPIGRSESILGGIIESGPDGPELAKSLLNGLAARHRDELLLCVVDLLRCARAAQRTDLLSSLNAALDRDLRVSLLLMLSDSTRLPNKHGLDLEERRDLATFLAMLRADPSDLVTVLSDKRIADARNLSVGYLIENITDAAPILSLTAAARLDRTIHLLSCALSDWSARDGIGEVEWYKPVQDLAAAVLNMPAGSKLIAEMLLAHPDNGTLLFAAMQWSKNPYYPTMLAELVANHVTVTALAGMAVAPGNDLRRLRIFEKLVNETPTDADPIMRVVVATYPTEVKALAEAAGERLSERVLELLDDEIRNAELHATGRRTAAPAKHRPDITNPQVEASPSATELLSVSHLLDRLGLGGSEPTGATPRVEGPEPDEPRLWSLTVQEVLAKTKAERRPRPGAPRRVSGT